MERLLAIVFAVLALGAAGYYVAALLAAVSFLRRPIAATGFAPPVTLLKPLKGAGPEAYANFRSHCLQDYPGYQLVFGVSDPADPAVPLVERLRREFPDRDIALVITPKIAGANPKVRNLLQMLPAAKHPYLVVNDGDIRVAPDYLAQVAAPLADPAVGMVTALYRGIAGASFASRLEAFGIAAEFMPGVLTARLLEGGVRFALGSTMALRRQALDGAGGFTAVRDDLADDYELGRRVSATARVVFADTVVDTVLPPYTLAEAWRHELRWGRTQRSCRPAGYAGRIFTFGLLWSALALIVSAGAGWAWALFALAAALRLACTFVVGARILSGRAVFTSLWLLPLRELFGFVVWVASLGGNTVVWGGESFILRKGKLHPRARA